MCDGRLPFTLAEPGTDLRLAQMGRLLQAPHETLFIAQLPLVIPAPIIQPETTKGNRETDLELKHLASL